MFSISPSVIRRLDRRIHLKHRADLLDSPIKSANDRVHSDDIRDVSVMSVGV